MNTLGTFRERTNLSPSSRSVFIKEKRTGVGRLSSPETKSRFDTHQANSFFKSPSKIPNTSSNKSK